MAAGGHQRLQEGGGRQQGDAVLGHLVGDRPEQGFGVALLEPGEHEQGAQVRAQIEEVPGGDLPHHDRLPDALLFQEGDHAAELADAEPVDGLDLRREFRLGLVEKGGGDQALHAGAPGGGHKGFRIDAVAGDQGDAGKIHAHAKGAQRADQR